MENDLRIGVITEEAKIKNLATSLSQLSKDVKILELGVKEGRTNFEQYAAGIAKVKSAADSLGASERQLINLNSQMYQSQQRVKNGWTSMSGALNDIHTTLKARATPAVVSMSQAFQDSAQFSMGFGQGLRAVANNVEYLSQQLILLNQAAGGWKNAFKAIGAAIMGPMGILMGISLLSSGIQMLTAYLSSSDKKAEDLLEKMTKLAELKWGKLSLINAVALSSEVGGKKGALDEYVKSKGYDQNNLYALAATDETLLKLMTDYYGAVQKSSNLTDSFFDKLFKNHDELEKKRKQSSEDLKKATSEEMDALRGKIEVIQATQEFETKYREETLKLIEKAFPSLGKENEAYKTRLDLWERLGNTEYFKLIDAQTKKEMGAFIGGVRGTEVKEYNPFKNETPDTVFRDWKKDNEFLVGGVQGGIRGALGYFNNALDQTIQKLGLAKSVFGSFIAGVIDGLLKVAQQYLANAFLQGILGIATGGASGVVAGGSAGVGYGGGLIDKSSVGNFVASSAGSPMALTGVLKGDGRDIYAVARFQYQRNVIRGGKGW